MGDAERITEAKRLYAEAGFTAASPLHLRVLFNSNPVIRRTAILTAAMWKETLGVETELTDEEYRVFLTSRLASSGVWVNQRQTGTNSSATIKFNVEFN